MSPLAGAGEGALRAHQGGEGEGVAARAAREAAPARRQAPAVRHLFELALMFACRANLPAGMQGLFLLPDLLPDLLSRRYVDQFKSEMNKLNGVIGESDQVARRIHSWPFGEFLLHSCMAILRILHCSHAWPFGEFLIAFMHGRSANSPLRGS